MEDCGENQVCVVGSLRNGRIFHRGCLTKNQFESKKAKCEKSTGKRNCIVAMCDTPNCRPELPLPSHQKIQRNNAEKIYKVLKY